VTYTFDENGYAIDPSTGDKIDVNTGDAVTSSSAADAVEAEDVSSGSASE
jgi:hypothetical protein